MTPCMGNGEPPRSTIARTVRRRLRTGGTVLLHDTDRTAAPGSWWRTLAASEALLSEWTAAGVEVGPLRDHFHEPARVVPEPHAC